MPDAMAAEAPKARASLRGRVDRTSFVIVTWCLFLAAVLLLCLPSIIVLITSFSAEPTLRFPPRGFSVRWYVALWQDSPEIIDAFMNSLRIAAIATAIAVTLGVAAAVGLARSQAPIARMLDAVFMLPLSLPTLALGLGLLMLFSQWSIETSLVTLAIGHVILVVPYVFRTTSVSLLKIDPQLLEAAGTLGASRRFAFATVTLPLALGGIGAGALVGAMNSFDNVSISLFLAGIGTEMLPLRLWNNIENLLDVRAAAVSGVLIVFAGLVAVLLGWSGRLNEMVRT
jgi:putative spermidine/putrescine transport system permease protein